MCLLKLTWLSWQHLPFLISNGTDTCQQSEVLYVIHFSWRQAIVMETNKLVKASEKCRGKFNPMQMRSDIFRSGQSIWCCHWRFETCRTMASLVVYLLKRKAIYLSPLFAHFLSVSLLFLSLLPILLSSLFYPSIPLCCIISPFLLLKCMMQITALSFHLSFSLSLHLILLFSHPLPISLYHLILSFYLH